MGFQRFTTCFLLALCILSQSLTKGTFGFACNWGTRTTHPLPPEILVKLMKDNGINKVKLFEAEPTALKALGKSGIQVMVGIPNDMLDSLATSVNNAIAWVDQNVSSYISKIGVDIRYSLHPYKNLLDFFVYSINKYHIWKKSTKYIFRKMILFVLQNYILEMLGSIATL